MSLTPFYVPDLSPLLAYGGSGDWRAAYTPRGDGYDQTFHQASEAGQTVAFNLTSTGFTVSHATVAPECPIEYSINGSDFRSTCDERAGLRDLQYGLHQVVLRTGNVTVFQLFGVVGNYGTTTDNQSANVTLDATADAFTYTPTADWKFLSASGDGGNVETTNDSVAIGDGSKSEVKVDLAFKGSAVYLYGRTGPEYGQAEVRLDDQVVATLNMSNAWETDKVLLYTAGGLDGTRSHRLFLESLEAGGKIAIDHAVISGAKSSRKESPLAPLIAGVVGGIVVIILLGVIVYLYLMARIKYKIRPALSNRSQVESWRKQTPPQSAEACSPCDAYPSDSPSHSTKPGTATTPGRSRTSSGSRSSGQWPIARLYTRYRRPSFFSLRSDAGGTDFSAPSYPDYIPYQSPCGGEDIPPVPPLPPGTSHSHRTVVPFKSRSRPPTAASATQPKSAHISAPKASPLTPPAIAGLDPFAERWLQENTYIGQPAQTQDRPRPTSGRSHQSQGSRGQSETSRIDEEPLSPHDDNYEIVGVTNARRSVARLWPSRDASPSLYRSNTLTDARGLESTVKDIPLKRSSTMGAYGQTAVVQTVPVSASASATAGISTLDSSFIRPSPLTLLASTSTASPQPSGYTPSSRNRPQTPLRRGVSIKSAKTVKSFFSGWIKGTDSNGIWQGAGGRPDTPARPQTAARPDSGIFPLTLGLGTVDVPLAQAERSKHMFIELDPSSPITASRPPSEWPDTQTGRNTAYGKDTGAFVSSV